MMDAQTLVHSGAHISADRKLAMYREMLRIRLVEEAIAVRYGEQKMRCPTHLCIGQEAPPVGVSAHLRKDDLVFSGHRSHGHYLAKGGDLKAMLAELYGRATGCAGGKGGSQHLIDLACGFMGSAPILASTISVGVGAAWAAAMNGEDRVVVVYFGDGATEEGTFHEAMNFAGVNRLPVLFVCENNLYSVHSTLDIRQPKRPIFSLGQAHGVAALHGDGNDVDVVNDLSREAVARARSGEGPTLIELATYRWKEHCGPGDDAALGYRTEQEVLDWKKRDPVATYAARLQAAGAMSVTQEASLRAKLEREVEAAFDFARSSPFPAASELLSHVYPDSGAPS
jgi:TPP-dependent pyruvate/acetoin dehydrogenase alpha subunit